MTEFSIPACILRTFPSFLPHKNALQKILIASIDGDFNAVQEYVTGKERIDPGDRENRKKSCFEYPDLFCGIFLVFCDIQIECRKKLSTSLDAEFNALAEYITCIERIDFWNLRKSEKRIEF